MSILVVFNIVILYIILNLLVYCIYVSLFSTFCKNSESYLRVIVTVLLKRLLFIVYQQRMNVISVNYNI